MADYISRKEAKKVLTQFVEDWGTGMALVEAIKFIPSEDVAPVRRGRWVQDDEEQGDWWCSECRTPIAPADCPATPYEMGQNYCPNCGAKMDKEEA